MGAEDSSFEGSVSGAEVCIDLRVQVLKTLYLRVQVMKVWVQKTPALRVQVPKSLDLRVQVLKGLDLRVQVLMGLDLRAQVQKTPAFRVQVPKVLASKINSTWRAPESCYSTPSSSDNLCLFFCLYPSSKYCSPEPLLEIVTSISVRRSLATCMDPVQNMTEPPHAVLDGTVSHKTRNLCFVRKKHEFAQQVSRKFKFLIEIRKI